MVQVINNVTMLAIIPTGAALIREREHGAIEHLLAMPVTPFEIMTSKIWAMALRPFARLRRAGAVGGADPGLHLFLAGAAMHLFATTSMGVFLGTIARRCFSSAAC